jgi:hypothetical protein
MGASISDIQKYIAASTIQVAKYQAAGLTPPAMDAITASQVNAYLAAQAKEVTMDTQSYLEKLRTKVKDPSQLQTVESFYGQIKGLAGNLPQQNVNNKVEVSVQGSILALADLDKAIEDAMLRIYRQNGDLAPAGSIK